MSDIASIMSRDPVMCTEDTRLQDVAAMMRARHVGAIVVATADGSAYRPLGIVTDRDIVVELVATGLDPAAITAGDIVTRPAVTIREHDSLIDAIHKMRSRGIRRLPVIDLHGVLVGVVTQDDLVHVLSSQLSTLARVAEYQPSQEARTRP
jgi:CBS domain-containing protein